MQACGLRPELPAPFKVAFALKGKLKI